MAKKITHILSSGNVFADLGLADADEHAAKANMAIKIAEVIDRKKLTQKALAALLEVSQSDVSLLANHKFQRFSTDRLMQFLVRLGQDVEITIKSKPKGRDHARITVKAA